MSNLTEKGLSKYIYKRQIVAYFNMMVSNNKTFLVYANIYRICVPCNGICLELFKFNIEIFINFICKSGSLKT
jgi:hypothetical protein